MAMPSPAASRPRVVIVGAGFGGLTLARNLRQAPVDVILIDQHNYHTFQPLLYQVATAGLEPQEIAHSVRGVFHAQPQIYFRLGTVTGVDWDRRAVVLDDGEHIGYDYLVLAAGATTSFFGVEGAQEHGFELKSLPDAMRLRSHIMRQFEQADQNPALLDEGALTFVVVGGGPTGVEMSGSLVELFQMVLRKDFPHLPVERARVILIEASPHVLDFFSDKSKRYAASQLRHRGVEVMLDQEVVRVEPDAVHLKSGTSIQAQTLIWAAGVRAHPLADAVGLEQTRGGRLKVQPDLSVPGKPRVFVIGDLAGSTDEEGNLYPQLAPVAMQGARHVARQIRADLQKQARTRFSYTDKGIMATIGRNSAVAELPGGIRTTGFIAWVMWLFLHLLMLVGFRNQLNVLINWAWNYITYDRSARLILDPPLAAEPETLEMSTSEPEAVKA